MRVHQVSVTGLFGLFNHTVPLSRHERITIVHGPNGFGKTVMLNMIAGLAEGNYHIFERIPFDEFRIDLDDGTSRIIRRRVDQSEIKTGYQLAFFHLNPHGAETAVSMTLPDDLSDNVLRQIDRYVPPPYSLMGRYWVDSDTGEPFSLSEIIGMFPNASKGLPKRLRRTFFTATDELQVLFVETNRLRDEEPDRPRQRDHPAHRDLTLTQASERRALRVESNSNDLVHRIRTVLADYAKHAQDKDRTFPERLVQFVREYSEALDGSALLSRMSELEAKRQRLVSLGILDTETGLRDLSEEDVRRAREALTIYVGDVDEKLKVFDDLVRRIGTLRDILNQRLPYKRLIISRDHGMALITTNGQEVELRDLSSGEQHQLVVLYELLFRAPKQGLVLVDEPEISLHVAWQSRFLPDLADILNVTDSYAIVATHSPMIIGTSWDLTVELEGPQTTFVEAF